MMWIVDSNANQSEFAIKIVYKKVYEHNITFKKINGIN